MEWYGLREQPGLGGLDFLAIFLYFVVTFGIALWFGRRQHDTDDFFVGGRHMPWFAVGLSILATLFSTITYVGAPGEVIRNGLGMYFGYLAVPLSMAVVMLLWIPFYMRLRLTSAYEYLEHRFSYPVRLIGAALFVLLRLGWMSVVIYVASIAVDRVKGGDLTALPGNDIYWCVGIVGISAAVYMSLGGIQAVIWTDVLQCALLLAGVVLAIGFVVLEDGTGPLDWWRIAATETPRHTTPPLFSWDVTVRVTIFTAVINNFFWNMCTHGADQVVLQRYFSTSSLKAARRSYLTNVLVDFGMVTLLSLAGLALLAFYLRNQQLLPAGQTPLEMADRLFPYFLGQLPAGFAGLILSAFLCDAMQTLEAGVNSITAVATKDIVPRLRRGRPRRLSDLTFARVMAFVITLVVGANSLLVASIAQKHGHTIIDIMPKFFNMFAGPLAALFVIGLFLPRCSTRSALPAVCVGMLVSVLWSWWREITGAETGPTIFLSIAVPWLVTVFTAALLGVLVEPRGPRPTDRYTWWAVTRRPLGQKLVLGDDDGVDLAASANPAAPMLSESR